MGKYYHHLTAGERDRIAILHAQESSLGDIAKSLSRSRSTISRELRRNRSPVYDCYGANVAQKRAERRKRQAAKRERLKCPSTRHYVISKLKQGWSPEQVSGRIGMDRPGQCISHEAIYQFVYHPDVRKDHDLIACLPRGHRKRLRRGHTRKHRKSHIPGRVSIIFRPAYILKRSQPGHWEADTIISRQSKQAIGVCLERSSRFLHLAKLAHNTSAQVRQSINRRLSRHPPQMRRTITYDNGSENVAHQEINRVLGTQSYFCQPFHSWEKGAVENGIGLVRRFLPKKTDFSKVTKQKLKHIERRLNNRPRKCLDFKTPAEVFMAKCCT
jgi:IS30 family transposase